MSILTVGSWGLMMQNLHDKWVATHLPITVVYLAGFLMGLAIIAISITNIIHLFVSKKSVAELIAVPKEAEDDLQASEIGRASCRERV